MILKPVKIELRIAFVIVLLFCGTLCYSVHAAELVVDEKIEYVSGGRRDPFVPLVGPGGLMKVGPDTTGLSVEGIVFDPRGGSLALINGDYYKPGDQVQGMNVGSILRDRVILLKEDEEKVLWIREEAVQEGEKKHEPPKASAKEHPRAKS